MDVGQIIYWITYAFIWLCTITSIGIMIPQVIAIHRNKYADNSSVFTYWIYFLCSLIWTIYQSLYILWRIMFDVDHEQPGKLELGLLFVQLGNDIVSTLLGVYLVIVKYHYLHIFKKSGKNKISEKQKLLLQKKSLTFTNNNIKLIDKQYWNFFNFDQKLCQRILHKKSFDNLTPKNKVNKLLKILHFTSHDLKNQHLISIYDDNSKLVDKFITNYKKVYPQNYQHIISSLKIKTTNLENLSYEVKLRIIFVQLANLI